MSNCTEEIGAGKIDFGRIGGRVVEGCFDGGSMTSDGGVMLLGATDRKLGLLDAAARCVPDPRNPLLIKHAVRDMLRQRVYGLALGWEDLNDHSTLREDAAMQTAVGVEREVASAPTLCLWRTGPTNEPRGGCIRCWSTNSSPASSKPRKSWCWTLTPPTTRCTASRRGGVKPHPYRQ